MHSLLGYSAGNGTLGYYSSPLEASANVMDIRLPSSALGGDEQVGGGDTTLGNVF